MSLVAEMGRLLPVPSKFRPLGLVLGAFSARQSRVAIQLLDPTLPQRMKALAAKMSPDLPLVYAIAIESYLGDWVEHSAWVSYQIPGRTHCRG